ncbi:MAG TPA: YdeI/OmpD-associated family protein [Fimbriimonadales bacterium]|nr:YdeI/OmpD-associated family protein [Fimbriimonadales bacterium]
MKTQKGVNVPDDFARELQKNAKALAAFEAMPPSHQREYIGAIEEAKKPETRQRRIAGAIEAILQWETERQNRKK